MVASLLAAGPGTVIEGSPPGTRFVVLKWDSMEQLKGWWDSPEYTATHKDGEEYAKFNVVAVKNWCSVRPVAGFAQLSGRRRIFRGKGKMKQLGILVVVAVALTGSMAWGQQPLKAAGQDAKPWVLHDQSDLSGVAVDLTRAVSKQIGVPIEYQPMVFADLIPAVDTGRIDIIATNMAITSEREQKVDFTSPYYNALPEALVVQSSDATPYRALADLKGLPVGAQKGSIQLALLQKIGGFSDIKIYDSQKDARQAVASGQIRATITPGVENGTPPKPVSYLMGAGSRHLPVRVAKAQGRIRGSEGKP